jgi:hypothetical protein
MTLQEQEHLKSQRYQEAKRYWQNGKDFLSGPARKNEFGYGDKKYVSTACGIAYLGALMALDTWLELKGVQLPVRNKKGKKGKSIEFYRSVLSDLDKKLLSELNSIYDALHLYGYYDGTLTANIIDGGMKQAKDIIDRIKPQGVL